MKHVLNLIFKNSNDTYTLFNEIRKHGFNGTVFKTTSLKHAIEGTDSDERHFLNLAHLEQHHFEEAAFAVIIVDEERLEELKNIIREKTENFTKLRGGMYSHPAVDFEGSF